MTESLRVCVVCIEAFTGPRPGMSYFPIQIEGPDNVVIGVTSGGVWEIEQAIAAAQAGRKVWADRSSGYTLPMIAATTYKGTDLCLVHIVLLSRRGLTVP